MARASAATSPRQPLVWVCCSHEVARCAYAGALANEIMSDKRFVIVLQPGTTPLGLYPSL